MRNFILGLVAVFSLSMLLLVFFYNKNYRSLQAYSDYSDAVDHSNSVIQEILRLENYLKDAETSARGYLLTADSGFAEPVLKFQKDIDSTFIRIRKLTSDNLNQQKNLDTLQQLIKERMTMLMEIITLPSEKNRVDKKLVYEGRDVMNKCRVMLARMSEEEQRLFNQRSVLKELREESTITYSIFLAIIVGIVLIASFAFLVREILKRISYQQSLELKIKELDQTTAELEQIAFVTSHDLQEPLRKIRTFSDMLVVKYKDKVPPELVSLLSRINQSSIHMQGLVSDLMRLTSLSAIREPFQSVQPVKIIEEVINSRREQLEKRSIAVTLTSGFPVLKGNKKNLRVLFDALLDNAIKFSRKDEANTISIRFEEVSKEEMRSQFRLKFNRKRFGKIIISDNGIGFAQAFAERIFVLFQRLHGKESMYEGRGIGLAMVRRIMINHSGFVTAEGTPGRGATFTLYFPLNG